MNARVPPPLVHPGPLYEAVSEALWSIETIASIGQREASLGNLAGVAFALRRIDALLRFSASSAAELRELEPPAAPQRDAKTFTVSEPA